MGVVEATLSLLCGGWYILRHVACWQHGKGAAITLL